MGRDVGPIKIHPKMKPNTARVHRVVDDKLTTIHNPSPNNRSTGDATRKFGSPKARLEKRSLISLDNYIREIFPIMDGRTHAFPEMPGSFKNMG